MKNKNNIIYVLVAVIALVAVFYFNRNSETEDTATEVVATTTKEVTEVKSVPNTVKPSTKPEAVAPVKNVNYSIMVKEKKLMNGVFVSPLHVTLDSRSHLTLLVSKQVQLTQTYYFKMETSLKTI
jgi:hypothetical protein